MSCSSSKLYGRRSIGRLVRGQTSWTYGELDAQANRIARWLRAHGVSSEDRVGVLLTRSPQLIASLLGNYESRRGVCAAWIWRCQRERIGE